MTEDIEMGSKIITLEVIDPKVNISDRCVGLSIVYLEI
jgi:hypothetical protein